MNNPFLKELLIIRPELKEEYQSQQYALSLQLIDIMLSLGFNSKMMADKIGCSLELYLSMESGDTSIPIADYEDAIKKFNI